jgi:hypothetical protein
MHRFRRLPFYALALVPPLLVLSITFADLWSIFSRASQALQDQVIEPLRSSYSIPSPSPSPQPVVFATPRAPTQSTVAAARPQATEPPQLTPTSQPTLIIPTATAQPTRTAIQPTQPPAAPAQVAPAPPPTQAPPPPPRPAPPPPPPAASAPNVSGGKDDKSGKSGKDDKSGKGGKDDKSGKSGKDDKSGKDHD